MIWSRYTHSALYIGNGMIIDSTWQHGVKIRSLAEFLNESSRVGVLRLPRLTSDQADQVIAAAKSKVASAYNFEGVKMLGVQKLDALTDMFRQSLGSMIDIPLSHASGFTPGDMVRLSQAGFLSEAGRLQVPAN